MLDGGKGAQSRPPAPRLQTGGQMPRLTRRRVAGSLLVAVIGLPLLTGILASLRELVDLPGVLLLYLLLVVAVATIGGLWPAAATAVGAFLLANWYFTPPLYHFTIAKRTDVLALLVFVAVAAVVSALVDLATRRAAEAARARTEAEALARLGGTLLHDHDPLPELVEQLRATFALDAAAVLRRDRHGWCVEAVAGASAPIRPEHATDAVELDEQTMLTLTGRRLAGEDRRVLRAFTDQLAVALESRRLAGAAADATLLAEANELRTALLAAVSHDLRTPLATIKTAVTSLLQDDVELPLEASAELLGTIDEQTDRLNALVGNLLDMSRLQTGALNILARSIGLDEIVPATLASLADHDRHIEVEVPETLPRVHADPALLERAIANVVANALAWSPADRPVRVQACERGGRVELRIIDHGPGIPADGRDRVFQPFQRLGDSGGGGVGLGLAVARGFVTAMGGEITPHDTPSGGLTMLLSLPVAEPAPAQHAAGGDPGARH
jgi:two-component system, OmpR family, sensor histidine kinase KdpD